MKVNTVSSDKPLLLGLLQAPPHTIKVKVFKFKLILYRLSFACAQTSMDVTRTISYTSKSQSDTRCECIKSGTYR